MAAQVSFASFRADVSALSRGTRPLIMDSLLTAANGPILNGQMGAEVVRHCHTIWAIVIRDQAGNVGAGIATHGRLTSFVLLSTIWWSLHCTAAALPHFQTARCCGTHIVCACSSLRTISSIQLSSEILRSKYITVVWSSASMAHSSNGSWSWASIACRNKGPARVSRLSLFLAAAQPNRAQAHTGRQARHAG